MPRNRIIQLASIFFLFLSIFFYTQPAHATAGIYRTINFQGKVVNKAGGTNIANGAYNFVFKLYDAASAGTQLPSGTPWSETQSITVTDGIFRATLGSSTVFPAGLDFNSDLLYLDITFNGETFGSRIRLTAVPYAFNAEKVSGLTVTNTTGTLTIPNATTVTFSGANNLTFTTSALTNVTLPSGTITLADLGTAQAFTNKTIGSTGLIFNGATTDITTVSNENFTIAPNGTGQVEIVSSATTSGNITMGGQLQVGRFGSDTSSLGNGSIIYNTTTNKFRCYQNGAWADCVGGGSGSSVWSDLIAPTAALNMNMYQSVGTSFATTFTYGNATSTTNLFNITDTASNNGTGYMVNFTTQTGSTLKPFRVAAAGVEGLLVNASGNVGIGTVSPSAGSKLDVNGNVNISGYATASASLSVGSYGSMGGVGNGVFSGFVGIGTATPTRLLDVSSLSSTATLANFDWSPGTATTSTADLFALNIGANGIIGNIFNVKDNGGSVFGISQSAINANLPVNFNAVGDVGIAYDINFTNSTSSFIKSTAPFYIVAGEVFNSSDLTLRTYNYGNVIVDSHLYVSNPTTTGRALAIFNQLENEDIFTASASGIAKFTVDRFGTATASGNLTMGGQLQVGRFGSDTGTLGNGSIMYNTTTNKFRCYQNGAWTDCIGAGGSSTLQDVYGYDADSASANILMTAADGSIIFQNIAGTQFQVTMNTSTAPTVDLMNILNTGSSQGTSTTGVDGLQIDFANAGSSAIGNAGMRINVSHTNTNASSTLDGLSIETLSRAGGELGEESAIKIGQNWENDIYFASNAATIKMGSNSSNGSSIAFKASNNANIATFREYFANSGYGAFEANGFINIDGSYFQDQFLRRAAQATADVSAGTSKYGDNLRWVFDEAGTNTTSGGAAYSGCIINQNRSISVNDTRGSTVNGVLELQPDTQISTTGSYGAACAVHMGDGTGTSTVQFLHAANKFVMYFKVKPSDRWTNTPTAHQVWMGASNYSQAWVNGITYAGTLGGIFLTNVTATNTSGAPRTQWAGISRLGTNAASVDCAQNIVTTGYALGRIEARGTSDVRFFMDPDVSNGIALTECGSGINGTNTAAIPGTGAGTSSNVYLGPYINVALQGGTYSNTNHLFTMYVDFVAFVQDDPRDQPGVGGLSPLMSDSDVITESIVPPPDPISGADVAENYVVKGDYLLGDIMVADKAHAGGVERTGQSYDRKLLGVVSESPGLTLGKGGAINSVPIALSGRVPVRVNGNGGEIRVGDPITSSDIPGVGMRAIKPGKIIGTALEDFVGTGEAKILVHVNVGYYLGDEGDTALLEQKQETTLIAEAQNASGSADISLTGLSATSSGSLSTQESVIEKITTFVQHVKIGGMLEVASDSLFQGTARFLSAVKFEQFVDFINEVVFRKTVTFEETVAFNKDMAGYAKIKKGSRFVDITFDKEFPSEPVVSANVVMSKMTESELVEHIASGICVVGDTTTTCEEKAVQDLFNTNVKYTITAKTKQGFMIMLEQPLLTDITFSWTALAIKDVKTYESKPEVAGEATSSGQLQDIVSSSSASLNEATSEASLTY